MIAATLIIMLLAILDIMLFIACTELEREQKERDADQVWKEMLEKNQDLVKSLEVNMTEPKGEE